MSEKGPDAFRTIGEVAEELDLPQHVLRFWETKFSQIRPTKRSSGRRFYRPEDVALVRTIRELLYKDGYTIRGVQQLLRERGIKGAAQLPGSAVSAVANAAIATGQANEPVYMAGVAPTSANLPDAYSFATLMSRETLEELQRCVDILRNARGAA